MGPEGKRGRGFPGHQSRARSNIWKRGVEVVACRCGGFGREPVGHLQDAATSLWRKDHIHSVGVKQLFHDEREVGIVVIRVHLVEEDYPPLVGIERCWT